MRHSSRIQRCHVSTRTEPRPLNKAVDLRLELESNSPLINTLLHASISTLTAFSLFPSHIHVLILESSIHRKWIAPRSTSPSSPQVQVLSHGSWEETTTHHDFLINPKWQRPFRCHVVESQTVPEPGGKW
jgi:hypothetical protein